MKRLAGQASPEFPTPNERVPRMDHYQTLGLSRNATSEEIQKAYHKLTLQYHPDANIGNPQAAEKYTQINKAYDVLRRAEKRAEYDATLGGGARVAGAKTAGTGVGKATTARAPGSNAPPSSVGQVPTGNPMADILGAMRSSARGGAQTTVSSSTDANGQATGTPTVEIKVTLRELHAGAVKTIKVNGRKLNIKISLIP